MSIKTDGRENKLMEPIKYLPNDAINEAGLIQSIDYFGEAPQSPSNAFADKQSQSSMAGHQNQNEAEMQIPITYYPDSDFNEDGILIPITYLDRETDLKIQPEQPAASLQNGKSVSEMQPYQPVPAKKTVRLARKFKIKTQDKRKNAYDIADVYIARQRLQYDAVMKTIYAYNGHYYVPLNQESFSQDLYNICEDILRKNPNVSLKTVYEKTALVLGKNKQEERIVHDSRYLCFQNGVLNLVSGEFSAHSPDFVLLYEIQCNYNPQASCPRFKQYLHEFTRKDPILEKRIGQMFGVSFTGDVSTKSLFFIYGVPNSGKSLMCSLLTAFFHDEDVTHDSLENMQRSFQMVNMKDKRLFICSDMPDKIIESKAVSELKKITGRDVLSSDVKHGAKVQFVPTCNCVFASNHPLRIRGIDEAFQNRVVTIRAKVEFNKEEQDVNLLDALLAEKEGIAAWTVREYREFKAQGGIYAGDPEYDDGSVIFEVAAEELQQELSNQVEQLVPTYIEESDNKKDFVWNEDIVILIKDQLQIDADDDSEDKKIAREYNKVIKSCYAKAKKDKTRKGNGRNAQWGHWGLRLSSLAQEQLNKE